ncbi:MAG: pkn1 [Ilumatobacteraceae bacterium]|nr:pkn1 [Ilumatobacteraceae bacterium]MCU1388169.1 pkn1 [Ilumatobacteraceae bacterium]
MIQHLPRAPRQHIPAGTFVQGDDHAYPEEAPARTVSVGAFAIDAHAVTNTQFAAFVADTGHVTVAERDGASVFVPLDRAVDLADPTQWWRHDPGASWRRPRGSDGRLDDPELADHPVVCVTADDAIAYARWAGGRLPTEAEWEWSAAGSIALPTTWPLAADGMLSANVWLGEFPWRSIRRAAPGTMPVGAFPVNGFGLFDMLGNVWELTSDDWSADHRPSSPCCSSRPTDSAASVAKGGSFLCAANYCRRYRPSARHPQPRTEAACHVGFRCAYPPGKVAGDD